MGVIFKLLNMTYEESLDYINNSLTSGSVYGLSRIKETLKRLSNPEKNMKIIHIAGTNGKGSISRMIMSILKEAGYTVGIFNSPYLEKKNEYLCCNGVDATDDEYALIAGIVKNAVEGITKPTEFEFSFAMAMEYFARKNCDFAIVECGLGGLTDATNIFEEKELSIIANIGLDHTKLLGDTIKEITKQKCGIIIKKDTVVAYPSGDEALKVITRVCKAKEAKLITPNYSEWGKMAFYNPGFPDNDPILKDEKVWLNMPKLMDSIALKGTFQKKNAMVALASVMALKSKGYKISYRHILNGLRNVKWPGRFETLRENPLVIADGGHNVQCAKALCESLDAADIKKAIFVIGIMADKDYKEVFKLLYPYAAKVVATEPSNPRRLGAEDICTVFCKIISELKLDSKSDSNFESKYNFNDIKTDGNTSGQISKDTLVTHSLLDIDIYSEKKPAEAVKKALKLDMDCYGNKMPIVITGSLYMMADIRKVFNS